MIARIASLAILRPKLAETVWTLDSAWNALLSALVSCVCSDGLSASVWIWKSR